MVMHECVEKGSSPAFRLQYPEDPAEFCNKIVLTYVSCSPFRVPISRRGGPGGDQGQREEVILSPEGSKGWT